VYFNNISLLIDTISSFATQIIFSYYIGRQYFSVKSKTRMIKKMKRDLILHGVNTNELNKVLKSTESLFYEISKLNIRTKKKLMKLNPNYLIRYYSLYGAFELGKNI